MFSRPDEQQESPPTARPARFLARRQNEALWECRHFGRYLRLSTADVIQLFDLVGLRMLDQRPTSLARFLELTYSKVVVDPTGQPVVWHRWYRDRTLRFIAKQPAAAAFFAKRSRREYASQDR